MDSLEPHTPLLWPYAPLFQYFRASLSVNCSSST
ncbi:unnamed protein product [Rhodiola kirilowii]